MTDENLDRNDYYNYDYQYDDDGAEGNPDLEFVTTRLLMNHALASQGKGLEPSAFRSFAMSL